MVLPRRDAYTLREDGTEYQFELGKRYLMEIRYWGTGAWETTCEALLFVGTATVEGHDQLWFAPGTCRPGGIEINRVIEALD